MAIEARHIETLDDLRDLLGRKGINFSDFAEEAGINGPIFSHFQRWKDDIVISDAGRERFLKVIDALVERRIEELRSA